MKARPDWLSFESFAREAMERERIAGVAAGVSVAGEVVYANGLGHRDIAAGQPVSPRTVFGIASVSKSFAALAVMQLVDEGLLDPLAPVVDYLPEFTIPGAQDIRAIKVHHCLSHTTGLPPLKRRQGEFTEFGQHLAYLGGYETDLLGYPGQYLSYCNDAFMVSGALVERLTGKRFRDHVCKGVFEPLGMQRTTYHIADLESWDDVTNLYDLDDSRTELLTQPWPELGTYHVGGGIRSTVLDLLSYGDMYCALGRSPSGERIVSEAGVLRMRQPVYPTEPGTYYGYGLRNTPAYHGVSLVEHGGSLPGVSCKWGYMPETRTSLVVLTNVRGVPADWLWQGLANTVLGLEPGTPRSPSPPTFAVTPGDLEGLLGTYAADEGARAGVKASGGGGLVGEIDGQTLPLRMTSPDTAVYESQGQEKMLTWYRDAGGMAWAVKLGVRMVRRTPQ